MNTTATTSNRALLKDCIEEARRLGVNPFALHSARTNGFATIEAHVEAKRVAHEKRMQLRAELRAAERAAERAALSPAREVFYTAGDSAFVRRVDGRVERLGTTQVVVRKGLVGMMEGDADGEITLSTVRTASGVRFVVRHEDVAVTTSLRWEAVYLIDQVGSPSSAREFLSRYVPVEAA